MPFIEINLNPNWKVEFCRFENIEPFLPNGERNYEVSEDLFQASLEKKGLVIDIGFYGKIYKVYLIKEQNWETPIVEKAFSERLKAAEFAQALSFKYV